MTHSQKSQFLSVALFISASVFTVSHCSGANYYIDSVAGNDDNTGLSTNSAWAPHTKIGSTFLAPGDVEGTQVECDDVRADRRLRFRPLVARGCASVPFR